MIGTEVSKESMKHAQECIRRNKLEDLIESRFCKTYSFIKTKGKLGDDDFSI